MKKYAANEDDDEPAVNSTAEHEAPAGQPEILPVDAEGIDFSSAAAAASSHKRPGQQAESSPSSCMEMKLLQLMGWKLFFWATPNLAHAFQNATSCKITTSDDLVCMSSNMKMRQFVHILSQVTLKTGRLSSTFNRRSGMINLLGDDEVFKVPTFPDSRKGPQLDAEHLRELDSGCHGCPQMPRRWAHVLCERRMTFKETQFGRAGL